MTAVFRTLECLQFLCPYFWRPCASVHMRFLIQSEMSVCAASRVAWFLEHYSLASYCCIVLWRP